LLKLGIQVAESTVAKYMARGGRGRSQTWKTFLRNHVAGTAAMDFLVVPTVGFKLLFVLVILRHQRRRLISLSVTANPTAEWIARQITDAFPWNEAPAHLIRDRDASYGDAVTRRLAAMGIRDHPTAPRSPWQNGHAERLIGSIRRECLDHIVVFGEAHLRRMLAAYATYYNDVRTHLTLAKDAPLPRPIQRCGEIRAQPILGGLHHQYCRI
jgi:transposase InsO family protein